MARDKKMCDRTLEKCADLRRIRLLQTLRKRGMAEVRRMFSRTCVNLTAAGQTASKTALAHGRYAGGMRCPESDRYEGSCLRRGYICREHVRVRFTELDRCEAVGREHAKQKCVCPHGRSAEARQGKLKLAVFVNTGEYAAPSFFKKSSPRELNSAA